jgi:phosphatidate cytidylyltransferase
MDKVSTVPESYTQAQSERPGLSHLSKRLIVAILIIVAGFAMVYNGGWFFLGFILFLLCVSAWEYWRLYRAGGHHLSFIVLVGGTFALTVDRFFGKFEHAGLILTAAVLVAMAQLVLNYRQAQQTAAIDFNLSLGGLVYIGWLGAYLISLRNLPNGLHWIMLSMPAVAFCDAGAYLVGSKLGRHKMAPLISPKKSWEGYAGGILFGTLGALGLAFIYHLAVPAIQPWHGVSIGLVVSILSPLGDLGESMLKRAFGVKDTGALLPGHGGMLDRIDSWLWAAPIAYFLITAFFL